MRLTSALLLIIPPAVILEPETVSAVANVEVEDVNLVAKVDIIAKSS
jgi:hypothetical protein